MDKFLRRFFKTLMCFIIFIFSAFIIIFHSPYTQLKELWVTTAMTTLNHKYLATWLVSDAEIKEIMKRNEVMEPTEKLNKDKIKISKKKQENVKEAVYEKPVIEKDTVEFINISTEKYKGYILKVDNPEKVAVGTTHSLGNRGEKLLDMVKRYNSIGGINAGGFCDQGGQGTGGIPTGLIIENSKIVFDNPQAKYDIVGFNKDNLLILGKYSLEEAKALNLRDAVCFSPILILNGKPMIQEGNGGWGIAPRTATGQTSDGSVLLLVIDGRQISSIGATLKDVQEILLSHGAINAANLDGGSSSTVVYEGEIKNKPCSKYGPRFLPSGFIIKNEINVDTEKEVEKFE